MAKISERTATRNNGFHLPGVMDILISFFDLDAVSSTLVVLAMVERKGYRFEGPVLADIVQVLIFQPEKIPNSTADDF